MHKITIHVKVTEKKNPALLTWQEMNPLHFGLFPQVKTNKTPHYKLQAISVHHHLVKKEWLCDVRRSTWNDLGWTFYNKHWCKNQISLSFLFIIFLPSMICFLVTWNTPNPMPCYHFTEKLPKKLCYTS